MDTELTSKAVELAGQGYYIFPVKVDGKDKKPLIKEWQLKATNDMNSAILMFSESPDATHVGIACGPSKLLVIDVDPPNGQDSLSKLERTHGKLPETRKQTTPRGGTHHIFKLPEQVEIKNSTSKLGPNLDVRTDGGFIVYYGWDGGRVVDCNPFWLARMSPANNKYGLAALDGESQKLLNTSDGGRNNQLNESMLKVGHKVIEGLLDETYAKAVLHRVAVQIGLEDEETKATINSAFETAKIEKPHKSTTSPNLISSSTTWKWYSEVEEKPIEWYDKPWLPKIGLAGLAGPPDIGKSTLLSWEIAKLTQEFEINVAYFSGREEDLSRVKSRLKLAGADLNRVGYFTIHVETDEVTYEKEINLAENLRDLRIMVKAHNIKAVYLDPGTSYIGVDEDGDRTTGLRTKLEMLKAFAENEGVLIRFIKHTKKEQIHSHGLPLVSRIAGHQVWTEVPRIFSILWPLTDKLKDSLELKAEDPATLLHLRGKNNNAPKDLPARAYKIYANEHGATALEYLGDREVSNEEIVEKTAESKQETTMRISNEKGGIDWVIERLKEAGSVGVPLKELREKYTTENREPSWRTIQTKLSKGLLPIEVVNIEGSTNNEKQWIYKERMIDTI